jgi:hypothetical protein
VQKRFKDRVLMIKQIESCSLSTPDYNIPGNLFLKTDWEENPTPNCGVLTLWILKETDNEDKQ